MCECGGEIHKSVYGHNRSEFSLILLKFTRAFMGITGHNRSEIL